MLFRQIFDPKLAQYAYLIGCQQTKEAIIIDPERDIDRYVELAESENLNIVAIAETHIHADFLSGSREFAERFDVKLYLSDEGDADWKYEWVKLKKRDGSNYSYHLLKDGETFRIGNIEIQAVHTPGHTPEHMSYVVTDKGGGASTPMGIATGDFVFVGDLGRPDLLEQAAGMHGVQEPSARTLFSSLPKFTSMDDYVQVWPAHGAGSSCGKALGAVPTTTVGYERLYNASLDVARHGEDAFVDAILAGQPEPQTYFARMKRDNKLGVPVLGNLPNPRRLTTFELAHLAKSNSHLIVDTRLDRSGFMAHHIRGSIYAPMNKSFNTVVGSLVEDETTPLVLIVDDEHIQEAVRDLIRIGYDNIVAYADTKTLDRYLDEGGDAATIPEIMFSELDAYVDEHGGKVLDVRFSSEYDVTRLPGAINASYTRMPEYARTRLSRDSQLLIHCASGARAAAAASYLARNGFDVVFVNGLFDEYAAVHKMEAQEPALA